MVEEIVKVKLCSGPEISPCVDDLSEVGDFGLATSSLAAAVEPSELAPPAVTTDAEMTLGSFVTSSYVFHVIPIISLHSAEVGTKLYIAPEVQSPKKGPRNHTKADMYSLGVSLQTIMWMYLMAIRLCFSR
jgi:serine/threonine protein kinase